MSQLSKDAFFKRYDIDIREGRLGGGAFGTVYKTYDTLRDEWKAVKIAEVKYINGKEFSLIAEFDAISALPVHKNIANYESVHRLHMPNGIFDYAVMQYYSEGNFKQLQKNHDLSIEEKTKFLKGLFEGIKFLHDNNRMHRDLKPSNILISHRKGAYIPKIADFGLSKNVNDSDLEAITNSIGGGTLEYSSPEQLLGKTLKFNTDIWSFGVIAYELFVGKIPFEISGSSSNSEGRRVKIYQNILNAPIPSEVYDCPVPFNKIIVSCLEKDPEKRCKNLHEFDDDIYRLETKENNIDISNEHTLIIGQEEDTDTSYYPYNIGKKSRISQLPKTSSKSKIGSLLIKNDVQKGEFRKWLFYLTPILLFVAGYFYINSTTSDATKGYEISETDLELIVSANTSEDFVAILKNNQGLQEMSFFKKKLEEVKRKEEKSHWESIKDSQNIKDFESFITVYPKGKYLKQANDILKSQIDLMTLGNESMQWSQTLKSESVAAVNAYIENFPEGEYLKEASQLKKIWIGLEEEEKWNLALKENTIESFENYIVQNPTSKNVAIAKSSINTIQREIIKRRDNRNDIKSNSAKMLHSKTNKTTQKERVLPYKESKKSVPNTKNNTKSTIKKKDVVSEWKQISTTKNIEKLKSFIKLFPTSKEANEAKQNIFDIEENNSFDLAIKSDAIKKLKLFLIAYPNSQYKTQVSNRIKEIELSKRNVKPKSIKKEKTKPIPAVVVAIENNMIKLLGGSYDMGCNSTDDCGDDATPSIKINFPVFFIGKFEVTQKEFVLIMGYNPSFFKDCDNCPVENISYYDALKFIKKINNLPGNVYTYRLPTEAEWEYAAGGSKNKLFAGTNLLDNVGYYRSNSSRRTHSVASKNMNTNNIFDMSGNVYEWCSTWYNKDYYTNSSKKMKVIRGGSWQSKTTQCKIKFRSKANPNNTSPSIGMRLARSL